MFIFRKFNNKKKSAGLTNNIEKQIKKLYLSSILGNLSLTGAWMAILAARGFSLVEIGYVETIFHITSLIFEIPSGVLADVFGRKKMLMLSTGMRTLGSIIMILSNNLFWVCLSIAFHAISYNFSSGTGDALAYDSLKEASAECRYERYISNQMILYRLCNGISTLCAGFALYIGYRLAYGTDIIMCVIQLVLLGTLREAGGYKSRERASIWQALKNECVHCTKSSFLLLKSKKWVLALMLCNSLVGALDILLLFFLQAKLPHAGMGGLLFGSALLFMQLGGVLGAKMILAFKELRYKRLFLATLLGVIGGILIEHTGVCILMTFGGFCSALCDDALQVRTNAIIQDNFPSEQRATLVSVESFTFSVIMLVLSPLFGAIFSVW